MNILMVDQFGETGGAQKCLIDLIAGWPPDDTVVVAAPADGKLFDTVRTYGATAAAIACGPYTSGRKGGRDAVRFCADVVRQRVTLRRLIRQHAIDVVYVNGPRVLVGATLATADRCPLIFHSHNRLDRQSDVFMVRSALRRSASTVIACCEHVAAPLSFALPLVIPNGVPDAGYRARQYPPQGPWRIGMVGRISPEKGHLILFDALRLLAAEARIAVTVAGATLFSGGGFEDRVRVSAAGLNVQFVGWIDNVGATLAGFDLLVVPSTAEPGLPRVVLEAFSAGVPVVALPSGGIPEAVRDSVTGFLAADRTPSALAACLRKAMTGAPAELSRVIHNARAEWESYWNVDRWRRDVMSAIRATVMEPGRPFDVRAASAASSGGRPARWV